MYIPTTEDVTIAWLKTVEGLDPTKVATSLPGDATGWAATGFVQVLSVAAGAQEIETPLYGPVVTCECWAVAPNSSKPPWGQAGSLATAIVWATHRARRANSRVLAIRTGYHQARLLSIAALGDPRRIDLDDAGYSRYSVELQPRWTPVIP